MIVSVRYHERRLTFQWRTKCSSFRNDVRQKAYSIAETVIGDPIRLDEDGRTRRCVALMFSEFEHFDTDCCSQLWSRRGRLG